MALAIDTNQWMRAWQQSMSCITVEEVMLYLAFISQDKFL